MANRLIRPLRRALLSPLLSRSKTPMVQQPSLSRSYVSEMRKSAFEGNILRLLRNEIQYEIERSPPKQAVQEFDSFIVEERRGEQWIILKKQFGENEEIKVEVTMFDGSIPVKKTVGDVTGEDETLHITLIVNVVKEESKDVLEFVCSAWPNSIEIQKVFMRGHHRKESQPYTGPEFKDLDDDLQESLYEYLETRGISDELAVFLHEYMKNKDTSEFIWWMERVKSFIEKK